MTIVQHLAVVVAANGLERFERRSHIGVCATDKNTPPNGKAEKHHSTDKQTVGRKTLFISTSIQSRSVFQKLQNRHEFGWLRCAHKMHQAEEADCTHLAHSTIDRLDTFALLCSLLNPAGTKIARHKRRWRRKRSTTERARAHQTLRATTVATTYLLHEDHVDN